MSIDRAIENLKSVRLRGGVFGKTTLLSIVLIAGVSAVCLKVSTWWIPLVLMCALMGIVFYALKRSFDFAENNPQAAIMDGAEFLQHERIVHATKDQGLLISQSPATDHPLPLLESVDEPDQLPTTLPNTSSEVAK